MLLFEINSPFGFACRILYISKILLDFLPKSTHDSCQCLVRSEEEFNNVIGSIIFLINILSYGVLIYDILHAREFVRQLLPRLAGDILNLSSFLLENGRKCVICHRAYHFQRHQFNWRALAVPLLECRCPYHLECLTRNLPPIIFRNPPVLGIGGGPHADENGDIFEDALEELQGEPAVAEEEEVLFNCFVCQAPVNNTLYRSILRINDNIDEELAQRILQFQEERELGIIEKVTRWVVPLLIIVGLLFVLPVLFIGIRNPAPLPQIGIPGQTNEVTEKLNVVTQTIRKPWESPSSYVGRPTGIPLNFYNELCFFTGSRFWPIPYMSQMWIYISSFKSEEELLLKEEKVSFHWKTNTRQEFIEITRETLQNIIKDWDNSLELILVQHGFTPLPIGTPKERIEDANMFNIAEEYLKFGNYNVIVVDAMEFFGTIDYYSAARGTFNVGHAIAKFLKELRKNKMIKYDKTHLIGHSLGGHTVGIAGFFVQKNGGLIGRITGLDVARPCFIINGELYPDLSRVLDTTDASFVQEIQCNSGGYGSDANSGDVIFHPNGGRQQPGCNWFTDTLLGCSHSLCTNLYLSSIRHGEVGCPCSSRSDFVGGKCGCESGDGYGVYMGEKARWNALGNYHLNASVDSPGKPNSG